MATIDLNSTPNIVAEWIARFLKARKVDRIFGLQGGHIQPIWDHVARLGIRIIDVRDEGAAVHMAHAHAERAGEFGVRVRHVHGGALVAHVDDADAEPRDVVPDRLDVPALESEDAIDVARLQEARDPFRAAIGRAVEVDGLGHMCPPPAAVGLRQFVEQVPANLWRSTRCRILPVAVRGMSCSAMNENERGRL